MALARLGGARRPENYTWPGFVDALATLLMVIIFVLLVFVLIQVNLAYRVAGQDATMNDMRAQIVSLGDLLNLERKANDELKDELAGISSLLDATTKERDSLVTQLANATATLSLRDSEIRQLTAIQAQTEESLEAARQTIAERVAALEAIELTLAEAQAKLMESEVEIADAAARNVSSLARISELETKNAASQAEVAQMTNAVTALRLRIEELTSLLAEKEAQAARDKIAIASLGKSLNNALASRVQELQRFRSEFFGRLREVLRGRDDVRIVGDRFVFQSEVLFAQGAASLGPEGEEKLGQLAVALNQIAAEIPEDIDWILQVEGHTDDIPVRAGRFADNWDLSTERALSVVRFLAESGLPANRLAAAGYGEFQPLDDAGSDEARRRNRRIEMKLTQRIAGN
ncbi:MAG: peptidoglycan-binding protein [Candidatus Puniceispirillaceae bacterium]|jgi:chemotaxis protein MotB|nr:flagellar motor protein [SAR116 cluster bacterium]MBR69594.1 flagellar motor protein [SAR116 cluster bacterium]MEC8216520.1 OmpA family protein [Pseudomonadota bacterium]MED5351401.1 OmpA family protein [Pseudomonadota bacterium]GIS12765.1 MAG: flagellar motor protein MotB [Alphaproteobacteria bacterium]|tara:strand:- start:495 stop:1706 length:1212 start_codon:yes stop_codon:yes gene_type:complete